MARKPKSAEVLPGPGFRIRQNVDRPPDELVNGLANHASPDLSDLLNRLYAMSPSIQNLTSDAAIAGPACTVRVYPGDNLMVHKSLDVAKPGDIVVVDANGCDTTAVLGDLVASKAKHRGIRGFVIDGLIRDLPEMIEVGLPVYAKGVTPVGPLHRGPGEINYPICCGGVVVNPGDVIIGDSTGVVVIPFEFAAETLRRARANEEQQRAYVQDVKQGEFSNDWVDSILHEAGCSFDD